MGRFAGGERRKLVGALASATSAPGSPSLITLVGPLGVGKSRIVQELYRRLAADQPQPPYWPEAIAPADRAGVDPGLARKLVAPDRFPVAPAAEIPFLWWGISCERRQSGGTSAALLHDAEQLYLHTLSIEARWGRGRRMASAVTDPEARARAFQIAGLAATLAGPLGIVAGAATATGYALSTRDAKDLAQAGAEAIRRRRRSSGTAGEPRELDARAALVRKQLELADDLAACLSGAVAGHPPLPTVVVIDDAHWADAGVLHLIRRILEHRDAPITIVATAWPDELERQRLGTTGAGLAEIIDEFGPDRCETIALEALTTAELSTIVDEAAPETDEAVTTALSTRADGNPFALRLLLSQQMVRNATVHDRIDLTLADVGRLPSGIEPLHRQLWEELPDEVRRTLIAGSCGGERLVAPLAEAAASAIGVTDPAGQLREAAEVHGWIRNVEDDLYEFTEASRRAIASDPGNLAERQRDAAAEALVARSLELVRSGWPGSLAARRALLTELVARTEQGQNRDLSGAHRAALDLAEILRRTNDLLEERDVLELAVAWSRTADGLPLDDQLEALIDLARVTNTLGDVASRDRHRAEAHALATEIATARPDDPVAIDELGESHVRMGDAARDERDLDVAEHHYIEAEEFARRALELAPDRPSTLRSLAYAHDRLGEIANLRHRSDEAVDRFETAVEYARQAAAAAPEHRSTVRSFAFSQMKAGQANVERGRLVRADEHLRAARSTLDDLVATDPDDTWSRRGLARAHGELSVLEETQGNATAAAAHDRTCLALRLVLMEERPDDRGILRDLALTRERIGDRVRREDPSEARDQYEAGLEVVRTALESQPDDLKMLVAACTLANRMGSLGAETAREVRANAAEVIGLADRVLAVQPTEIRALDAAASAHERLGDLAHDQDLEAEALHCYRAAASTRRRSLRSRPRSARAKRALSIILRKVGNAALATGDLPGAADALLASAALAAEGLTERGDDEREWRSLARTWSTLANIARLQGNSSATHDRLLEEHRIWQRLLAERPGDRGLQRREAACLVHLGDVERRLSDLPSAHQRYESAQATFARLAAENPNDHGILRQHSRTLGKLAGAAQRLGDHERASAHLSAAIEVATRLTDLAPSDPQAASLLADLEARLPDRG